VHIGNGRGGLVEELVPDQLAKTSFPRIRDLEVVKEGAVNDGRRPKLDGRPEPGGNVVVLTSVL
jgi:hypothetical protein